jgi:uncharacterized membrane protein YbhN (UPF0104 family)
VHAAVSLGLLALTLLALRQADLRGIGARLANLPRTTLLVASLLSLAQALAMATRLWSVFPHGARPGWAHVARAFGFGQLANSCLPGRVGDLIKALAMSRPSLPSGGTDTAGAMGVMLADKAVDAATLTLLVTAFAPALLAGLAARAYHATWIGALAVVLAALAALALRRARPAAFREVRRAIAAALQAVRALMTPRRLFVALALGTCAWVAEATSMRVLSAPFGLDLSIPQAMVGLLVLNVGIALPVSLANLGAYEAATVVGLVPFGATPPQAVAIGAIHHAVQVVAIALFALTFWLRDRLTQAAKVAIPTASPAE